MSETSPPEVGFNAPDLDALLAYSPRLKSTMVLLWKHPERWLASEAQEMFKQCCDQVRLELRICVDYPPGVREPADAREALAYMRHPSFCETQTYLDCLRTCERDGADPRLVKTLLRVCADARKLGVPLWPSRLPERLGKGKPHWTETDKWGQIGHAELRRLPWACWALIDLWVENAGRLEGYALQRVPTIPGEYEIGEDVRPWSPAGHDLRRKRLGPREAETEREALFAYFSGGQWPGHPHDAEAELSASPVPPLKPDGEASGNA